MTDLKPWIPWTTERAAFLRHVVKAESQYDGMARELAAEVLHLREQLGRNRCHNGHETLPLTLWDCPECHDETRRKLEQAEASIRSLATMLGWLNVPPHETLERHLNALRARVEGTESDLRAAKAHAADLQGEIARLTAERDAAKLLAEHRFEEVVRLTALINSPEIHDFAKAVQLEAAHQRERWGSAHDAGKADADWFWLIGYLAGKALHTELLDASTCEHVHASGEPCSLRERQEKKLHRIITVAAAACNWHAAILGKTDMRPGIETPAGEERGA